jgi:cell division septation protein DedD
MADDEETEAEAPAQGDLPKRVDTLESKIDTILSRLSGGPAKADDGPEPPPNVAHEIRQQLDERDARAKKQAEEDGIKAELGEVKVKLSELTEKAPGPLPRRIEKWMGWTG